MSIAALLQRAKGPLGPPIELDFGIPDGPFAELAALLTSMNGFFAYEAGVQFLRAGEQGQGYDLMDWNSTQLWKSHYEGMADDYFCFAQDVLGTQFAIHGEQVVRFDPEDATHTVIGSSLADLAAWLAADPQVNATEGLAYAWQQEHGALEPTERLLTRQLFILGGDASFGNLIVKDSVESMRIRGPIAVQLRNVG